MGFVGVDQFVGGLFGAQFMEIDRAKFIGSRQFLSFFGFREVGVIETVTLPGDAAEFDPFDFIGQHFARLQVFDHDGTPVGAAYRVE